MRKLVVLIFVIASVQLACAQTYNQTVYWVRYQNQYNVSPTVYTNLEIDNRRFINPDVQTQLIFHSRVHKKINRWEVGGGLTYSFAYAAMPEQGPRPAVQEFRPVVEVFHEQPVSFFSIQNRIRVDNRFFQVDRETSVFEESSHVVRLRYRLQLRVPLKKNESNVTTMLLKVWDEIMVNTEQNFYDQNRIYATSEFYLNKNFSVEAGYIYIHQQRFGRDEFFNRHVLRFSVLHRVFRSAS